VAFGDSVTSATCCAWEKIPATFSNIHRQKYKKFITPQKLSENQKLFI
jgi:hypothetical protein